MASHILHFLHGIRPLKPLRSAFRFCSYFARVRPPPFSKRGMGSAMVQHPSIHPWLSCHGAPVCSRSLASLAEPALSLL